MTVVSLDAAASKHRMKNPLHKVKLGN